MLEYRKICTFAKKIITMKKTSEQINNQIKEIELSLLNIDKRVDDIENKINKIVDDEKEKSVDSSDRKYDLLQQIHQQYTEKESEKNSFFVSFLAVVFVVFIGYGIVYTNHDYSAFLIHITLLSFSILCFLNIICLYFSYLIKTDQLIVYEIRNVYGIKDIYRNPYKKWNYIPAFFKIMIFSILFYTISLFILSITKDMTHLLYYSISLIIVLLMQLYLYLYFLKLFRGNKKRLNNIFNKNS